MREAEIEAGLDPRSAADPYGPYPSPGVEGDNQWQAGYHDNFDSSNQNLPLVANASPFQRADLYDDDYENRSLRSEDFDGSSRFGGARDDSASNFGSESYAPSRNMFQDNKKTLADKEALPGEIQEGETTEVIKETSARRRWVALCWMLTFWCPTPFLRWCGRMKRIDVQQAWREKLALNLIIWFICLCAVFVIAILGLLICPTQHVYNQSEIQEHSSTSDPNNVFTTIRGEVFDLGIISATHQRIVSVVPVKSLLKYGGTSADNIFPVQVSLVAA
jgi:chitin synthase